MRLTSIRLFNFRSFQDCEIAGLERINYFGGPNRAGKSTIVDALSMALSGTCRRGKASGLRYAPKGEPHKDKWRIGITIQAPLDPKKMIDLVRREGEGPRSETQVYVENILKCPGAAARACIYSGEILELAEGEPKAAQELILDLVRPRTKIEVDKKVLAMVAEYLPELAVADPLELTLERVEQIYKAAYHARAEANRNKKQWTVALPPVPKDMEAIAGMDATDLRHLLADIAKKVAAYEADRKKIRLPDEVDRTAELERLDEAIMRLGALTPPDREKTAEEARGVMTRLQSLTANRQALEGDLGTATAAFNAANLEASSTRTQLEIVKTLKAQSRCPTCTQIVEAVARQQFILNLEEKLTGLEKKAAAMAAMIQEHEASLAELDEPEDLENELNGLSNRETQWNEAQERLAGLKEKRAKLADQKSDAELAAKAKDLDSRIEVGRGKLSVVEKRLAKVELLEEYATAKTEAEGRWTALDTLCADFGPEGLRTQFADGTDTEGFLGFIGAQMEAMGFPECDMLPLLNLTGEIMVNRRPASWLSASERQLFGVAFSIAAAKFTGLNLIAVDEMEALDAEYSVRAQKMIVESESQAFLFAVVRKPIEEYMNEARKKNMLSSSSRIYAVSINKKGQSSVELPGVSMARLAK